MTDLQQADSKPNSLKAKAITLLAGAIVGAVIGVVAWSLLLTTSQATAVISIGRFEPGQFIEEPLVFIERIKLRDFATAVAARAGIPELSTLLPARTYGGTGALNARSLRAPNLIEIRISLMQPEIALKAMTAIVDELVADHDAQTAPLIQNLQSTLNVLDKRVSEMIEASDAVSKRISDSSQSDDASQQVGLALLSARALTESGLGSLVRSEGDLKVIEFNIRRTQIIAAPSVTTPKTTAFYQVVAAGILAGLLAGVLLLQMFPGFFRSSLPDKVIVRPDPV